MKMKKLFLFALGITALSSAHAQMQQVATASSFDVVPGNVTIDGKAYPIGYDENNNTATFNIYDSAFNMKRSCVIPLSTYEYKSIEEESNLIHGTIIFDNNEFDWSNEYCVYEDKNENTINTTDDFLEFCYKQFLKEYPSQEEYPSLEEYKNAYTCLIDNEGCYCQIEKVKNDTYYRQCDEVGKSLPYINYSRLISYNPKIKKWTHDYDLRYWINYDSSQATTWTLSYTGNSHECTSYTGGFSLVEADKGFRYYCSASQNLFNDDEKTEFVFVDYKEVSREEYYKYHTENKYYNISKVISGSDIVLTRNSYDKFYTSILRVINEDGTKILELPHGVESYYMMRIDDTLYWVAQNFKESIVYSIPRGTSALKEVARVKNSHASRTYNLAGQQVGADTKGIIIRDGKKILNK